MDHFIPPKTVTPQQYHINKDAILEKYPTVSCLEISPNLDFKIHLAQHQICIDRSIKVFDRIKSILCQKQYQLDTTKYIFHSKSDAINIEEDNLYILSHSRLIGNKTNILWPLVTDIMSENIFPLDLKLYMDQPDHIPWDEKPCGFIFRGASNGIFTDHIRLPWQPACKRSRVTLLKEYLKLPAHLQQLGDVGFCNISEIKANIDNLPYWENRFGKFVRPESSITDVITDARLIMEHERERMRMQDLYRYKFILCPEGFDVSSSMNWVLASKCIAICPPFHYENFVINPRELQPFVHYLPVRDDYTDLGDVLAWGFSHPQECNQIVTNANAYMVKYMDAMWVQNVQHNIIDHLIRSARG